MAELGFDLDPSGLKQGADGLKNVTQEAKNLADQTQKTNAELAKVAPALSTVESAAKRAGISVEEMRARTAAFTAETTKLSAGGGAASAISQVATAATTAAPAVTALGNAVKGAAAEHQAFSTQGMAAFHSMRSLAEQAAAGQLSITSFAQQLNHLSFAASGEGGLAGAFGEVASKLTGLPPALAFATLGVGAAALAFAGFAVELAKTGDEIQRQKNNFAALTGSAETGAATYTKIKDIARSSGADYGTLTAAINKTMEGQNSFNATSTQTIDALGNLSNHSVIYANTANRQADAQVKLGETFGTLNKSMELNAQTAEQEAAAFKALSESLGTTGTLTASAFQKITQASAPLAQTIAQAFGVKSIQEFQQRLAQTPVTVDQLINAVARIKPATDAAFADPKRPLTYEQAIKDLTRTWDDLKEAMAEGGVFTFVAQQIEGIAAGVRTTANEVKALISVLNSATQAASSVANAVGKDTSGQAMSSSSAGPGMGSDAFGQASDTSSDTSDMGAFASGGSFTVGGTGGTDSQQIQFMATPGEVVTISPPGTSGGSTTTIGSLTPSGSTDIAALLAAQTAAIVAAITKLQLPANATASATNTIASGGALSAVATAMGFFAGTPGTTLVPTAQGMTVPGTFAGGGGGGGGGGVKSSGSSNSNSDAYSLHDTDPVKEKRRAQQQAEADGQGGPQINSPGSQFASMGISAGMGTSIRGASGSQIIGQPLYQGKPVSNAVSMNPNNPTSVDPIRTAASQAVKTGDETKQTIESSAQKQIDAANANSEKLANSTDASNAALTAALSAFGNDITSELAGAGGGGFKGGGGGRGGVVDSGGGFGGVGDAGGGFGTGPESSFENVPSSFDTGTSAFNDYGMNYGAGDYGQPGTGSSVSDVANTYMNMQSGSGFSDTTDYASQVADGTLPAFAGGGSFTVGGSGGTDTKLIRFMATPGELVTVSPGGSSIPGGSTSGLAMPSGISGPTTSASQAASAVSQTSTKVVNMFLHPGMNAETIIRSRAQIQRAM